MSLRSRILLLAVGAAAAVVLLLAIPVVISAYDNAEDEAERDATTLAQGVADLASTDSAERAKIAAVVERANDRRTDIPVTVALADGTSLGAGQPGCTADAIVSESDDQRSGGERDGDGENGLEPISAAETVHVDGGVLVRVAAGDSGDAVVVCAFVADQRVRETVASRLGALGAAGLGVLALVAGAALWVARRLGRHLTVTARTADRLGEGDLSARVPDAGPAEVRRVGAALNRLAERIDELLTRERETAADLSHRLRTPLTAVRLDVEALPPSPAKDELDADLAQLERTLTAVIKAARRPQREGPAPGCDAVDVTRARFEYWSPLLEEQGRAASLILDVSGDGVVRCASDDLVAALDALLENAVAHTPDGAAVEIIANSPGGGWVQVEVRDQGEGIPQEALQRGLSDRGSSGLGLDIARACAEASGGRLELARIHGWTVVRLVLGPA